MYFSTDVIEIILYMYNNYIMNGHSRFYMVCSAWPWTLCYRIVENSIQLWFNSIQISIWYTYSNDAECIWDLIFMLVFVRGNSEQSEPTSTTFEYYFLMRFDWSKNSPMIIIMETNSLNVNRFFFFFETVICVQYSPTSNSAGRWTWSYRTLTSHNTIKIDAFIGVQQITIARKDFLSALKPSQ